MASKIEWTDEVWNCVRGCSHVSLGCANCYAERQASRFAGTGEPYAGLVENGRWNGAIRMLPELLVKPLRWKRPRMVFVNSMSDLFHERVPFDFVAAVFGIMAATPQHTYQVLTKRPKRMVEFFEWISPNAASVVYDHADSALEDLGLPMFGNKPRSDLWKNAGEAWPLPNVWVGVTAEYQMRAEERVPLLLQVPAALRFVSCEPLVGPVHLGDYLPFEGMPDRVVVPYSVPPEYMEVRSLDWVIVGGESGPAARPCDVGWIRAIVERCKQANVPCFVKQLGAHSVEAAHVDGLVRVRTKARKGNDPSEWAPSLRVQQMPEATCGR